MTCVVYRTRLKSACWIRFFFYFLLLCFLVNRVFNMLKFVPLGLQPNQVKTFLWVTSPGLFLVSVHQLLTRANECGRMNVS